MHLSSTYDDWKVVNCAGCGELFFGRSMASRYRKLPERRKKRLPKLIRGVYRGRPHCSACLRALEAKVKITA